MAIYTGIRTPSTWSHETSVPRGQTDSGWPTSPTSPPAPASLYLDVVVDAWSRRVVGWSMQTRLKTELVLKALDMAVEQRRPHGVILHSDQGCQYTSIAFGLRCKHAGVRPSMGSRRGCLRQRALRELLCHPGVRTHRAAPLPKPGRGPNGGLRLHRRLVQPPSTSLQPRSEIPLSPSREITLTPLESPSGYPSTARGQLQSTTGPLP